MLVINTSTRTGGCFRSNCDGEQGEPVLGKGRKCTRMRGVWGVLLGSVHASHSGNTTEQTKDTVSRYRYVIGAVSFLGSPSTSVVAAAERFLGCPTCG